MCFELQRTQHLPQLAERTMWRAVENARDLHRQRRAAGDETAMNDRLADRACDRERVDARVFVDPAVLVGQQRLDVERRDVFRLCRIAPDAVVVWKGAER